MTRDRPHASHGPRLIARIGLAVVLLGLLVAVPSSRATPTAASGQLWGWTRGVNLALSGYDPGSHSLALSAIVNEVGSSRLEVVDARTGVTRWQSELNGQWYGFGPGIALIGSLDGLSAVGLDDGGTRWHVPSSGSIWPIAGAGVVALTSDARITGYSAATGQVRWQWDIPADCRRLIGASAVPDDGNAPLVVCTTGLFLVGLADGRTRWSWQLSPGCQVVSAASAQRTLAVATLCGERLVLQSLAVGSAPPLWERTIPRTVRSPADQSQDPSATTPEQPEPIPLAVASGVVVAGDADGLVVYDHAGSPIVRLPSHASCASTCARTVDGQAMIGYSVGNTQTLMSIDPALGRVRWRRDVVSTEMTEGYGGLLYSIVALPEPLRSSVIQVLNPLTGALSSFPLPVDGLGLPAFVDGANAFLFAYSRRDDTWSGSLRMLRLDRYVRTPQLSTDQWPDACRLLDKADLTAISTQTSYIVQPGATVLSGIPLRHPVSCRYLPELAGAPQIDVDVSWVGNDSAAAADLLRAGIPDTDNGYLPGVGDGEVVYDSARLEDTTQINATVRVGGTVATLRVIGGFDVAVAAARAVATHMHTP
jgi:outer membrane protein assembly factor BamB